MIVSSSNNLKTSHSTASLSSTDSDSPSEWIEIVDPQSNNIIYANPVTGECSWEKPPGIYIKPRSPGGEWWELFDVKNELPYYYNTETKATVWARPKQGLIIPLAKIQTSALGSKAFLEEPGPPNSETSSPVQKAAAKKTTKNARRKSLLMPMEEPRPESMFTPTSGKVESPNQLRASSYVSPTKPTTSGRESKPNGNSSLGVDSDARNGPPSLKETGPCSPPGVDTPKSLPSDLQSDINRFQINGFAKKFFSTHKKGLFRKKVPLEKLLVWTSESLSQPLMVLDKSLHKDALKCFKGIQRAMLDRPPVKNTSDAAEIQWIIERGIAQGGLRDEIYVQICRQLTDNPRPESVKKGWQILSVIVTCFPPSKNFESYFKNFLHSNLRLASTEIKELGVYCQNKFDRICKSGPRGKVPALSEIEQGMEAAFNPSVFGESLSTIMSLQEKVHPKLQIPRVLPFLSDSVLQLRGDQSEGIFRVPGDMEQVAELRMRVDKDNYTLDDITDCNVPASLLKFWLRDLEDPLIPAEFYDRCLTEATDIKSATKIIDELPEYNRRVCRFVIQFLQVFAREESSKKTKMSTQNLAMVFAPSFLRCPSDDLTQVFTNSKKEQEFLRILITDYHTNPQDR